MLQLSLRPPGEGMKFGQLILRRIVEIVATKCQILRLKCTKIDFGPHWGSLQRSPRPPSWIKGPILLREGGYRKRGEWEREGKVRGGEEGEGKVRDGVEGTTCVSLNFPSNNL